jgi:uncharacterized protein (DUF1684 family)
MMPLSRKVWRIRPFDATPAAPAQAPETLCDVDELELLDWKRHVFAAYAEVRAADDHEGAWREWRDARDRLFREHPQSPLPAEERAAFGGLAYFDYDPALRVHVKVTPGDDTVRELAVFWLDAYGGGVFLPFTDGTSGSDTYGGGRYVLDTVKGADLGEEDGRLVLDFNFAYNPSCAYDPRWVCPLSPPENRLPVAVRAGEQHRS